MSFNIADGGLAPYLVLIAFGFLPSEVWRWISVILARGMNENSEILGSAMFDIRVRRQ